MFARAICDNSDNKCKGCFSSYVSFNRYSDFECLTKELFLTANNSCSPAVPTANMMMFLSINAWVIKALVFLAIVLLVIQAILLKIQSAIYIIF